MSNFELDELDEAVRDGADPKTLFEEEYKRPPFWDWKPDQLDDASSSGAPRLRRQGSNEHELHMGDKHIGFSYETPVAECDHDKRQMFVTAQQKWDDRLKPNNWNGHTGVTTQKHIHHFRMQHFGRHKYAGCGADESHFPTIRVDQSHFDNHERFGGSLKLKAHGKNAATITTGNGSTLFSYGVPVAHHDHETGKIYTSAKTSTSKRHVALWKNSQKAKEFEDISQQEMDRKLTHGNPIDRKARFSGVVDE